MSEPRRRWRFSAAAARLPLQAARAVAAQRARRVPRRPRRLGRTGDRGVSITSGSRSASSASADARCASAASRNSPCSARCRGRNFPTCGSTGARSKRAGDIARLFRGGDDGLLKGVARIFEREGFRIVGIADFAPELLRPAGRIAGPTPDGEAEADIAFGARAARARCRRSTSGRARSSRASACSRSRRRRAPTRCWRGSPNMRASGRLRLKGRAGVFVKAAKRGQDMRFDLPAVGPATIEAAARAELAGLAIAAGRALIVEREAFVAAARGRGPVRRSASRLERAARTRARRGRAFRRPARLQADAGAARGAGAASSSSASAARRWRPRGSKSLFPMSEIAVMGILPVLARLPTLLARIRRDRAAIVAARPDGLVIIDSPDFTHRVARRFAPRCRICRSSTM